MFEKLAEESWQNKDLWYKVNADESAYKTGFKDGYNKCFKQVQKIVNEHTRLDCIIPELLRLKEE